MSFGLVFFEVLYILYSFDVVFVVLQMKPRRLISAMYRSRAQGQICLEVLWVHYFHLGDAKHQTEAHIKVCQLPSHPFPWWWQCCASVSSIVSWSKLYPALPLPELVLLPLFPADTAHTGLALESITTTEIEFSDLCAAPEARCAQIRTHPVEPTSTLATTNPPHLAACRPSSLKCSSHPYNKDNSIDFFYKVVEGLMPAMPPEHFPTQQRPWRLICSRPNGSAFSPSRLKMQ